MAGDISNLEKIYSAEMEYKLKKCGFSLEEGRLLYSENDTFFTSVEVEVDEKRGLLLTSCKLLVPDNANGDDAENHSALTSRISEWITSLTGKSPEIHSSIERGDSSDESVEFVFDFDSIESIVQLLDSLKNISLESITSSGNK